MTGAFDKIDIVGEAGQTLRDKWIDGPLTVYGLAVNGFPNMLTLAGHKVARWQRISRGHRRGRGLVFGGAGVYFR